MKGSKEFADFIEANRLNWNAKVKAHVDSEYYNVKEFMENPNSLSFVADEDKDLGNVKEKTILHLQCHFGLDSLSLARMGAKVTGVDISGEAIAFANKLKNELELPVTFIESDIYELKDHLNEKFDIVFTSVGVLCWLPDLQKWADIISYYLKSDGLFYVKDGHPIKNIVAVDEQDPDNLILKYPYFNENKTYEWDEDGTYANPEVHLDNTRNYQWDHTLEEVFNSIINSGLRITEFKEYAYLADKRYPCMKEKNKNKWFLTGRMEKMLPLAFSIKARK